MHDSEPMLRFPFAAINLLLIIPFLLLFVSAFRKYTGLSRRNAFLALIASAIAGGVRIYFLAEAARHSVNRNNETGFNISFIAAGQLTVFLTAFVLRLWGRWIGGLATDAERQPGVAGIGAWFCASNVFVGVMVVLGLWLGEGVSALLGTVIVGALLAAYPVLRMESAPIAPAAVPVDLSAEREKILTMLQAGKLTADESAELLQALSATAKQAASPVRQVPLTGGQRFLLIGAGLVLLGFFLPWFTVNLGKEANRMMGEVMPQMGAQFSSPFGGNMELPQGVQFPDLGKVMKLQTADISIRGADISNGLGWVILLLAATAALLPYVATTLDAATTRTARLICLGLGAVMVLYLLTSNIRLVSLGLILVVAGYALQIAGVLRAQRPPSE